MEINRTGARLVHISNVVLSNLPPRFDVKEAFLNHPKPFIRFVSNSFKEVFGDNIEELPIGTTLSYFHLEGWATDRPLQEVAGKRAETSCAEIHWLMENREDLLDKNNYNVFFVRSRDRVKSTQVIRTVYLKWDKGWDICANLVVYPFSFRTGDRIFYRKF